MKMLLRIFRFDKNTDYEAYYKPYVFEQDFSDFTQLLKAVATKDIYFDYDLNPDSYIVVNGYFIKQNTSLGIFNTDEFVIEPLDTKRSFKDLLIDKSDFYEHLKDFEGLIDENDKELYKNYDYLFYQSELREFNPDFKGDSYLIFIRKMLLKYPEKSLDFLKLTLPWIYYHTSFKHTLLYNVDDYCESIKKLKSMLFEANLLKES